MPTIFDNIDTPFLENQGGNGLRDALKLAVRGDFCVGYFNLRGWRSIDDVVEAWPASGTTPCRLLVGMNGSPDEELRQMLALGGEARMDNQTALRLKKQMAAQFRQQLTYGAPTDEDEAGLQRLARQLEEKRLTVKLYLAHSLHAKLYLAHRADTINPTIAYVGSSNLTFSGLRGQGELNVDVLDKDAAAKLTAWFEARWKDRWCLDITAELIQVLHESWARPTPLPPHHIYLKMAWHLSRDARDGVKEFRLPADVSADMLPFQVKAVQLACRRIHKHRGVLVGDVVGLGKTRIASGIARVMGDDHMLETLIICPKNLTSMWDDYAHRFKFRAHKILSHSRVIRELNDTFPRYRFVIIDESHNFRNREGRTYQAIHQYLEKNDCKVVLLSATPYNKTCMDLASQLRLFVPDQKDIGIRPEAMLKEMGTQFGLRFPNVLESSLEAFEKSLHADDWRQIMAEFMVRRTRSFIVRNYAEKNEADVANPRWFITLQDGVRAYFPNRSPKKVEFRSDPDDPHDPCARLFRPEVVDAINRLQLPRYGLTEYVRQTLPDELRKDQLKILDDLSRAGQRLMGFCRTNLFKRLESSAEAFKLSVHRHVMRNYIFLHALEKRREVPIGQQSAEMLDSLFSDSGDGELNLDDNELSLPALGQWDDAHYRAAAAEVYEMLATTQQHLFRWLPAAVFKPSLATHLQADCAELHTVLADAGLVQPSSDYKLQSFISLVHQRFPMQKFLVFTQFADTAKYLGTELEKAGVTSVDVVTGQSENPAENAWRFSPDSNGKLKDYPPSRQTRVLIATDVLSEGQNLQDSANVVNYDLPWALIRLIQRAGRVDRIGQRAEEIRCWSFMPADGVEKIIKLRRKLTERIKQNEEVVGSDEAFFDDHSVTDDSGLRDLYNEKSGVLDEPDDDEVDLTSEAYEIWSRATKDDPDLRTAIEQLPDVVYSAKAHVPDPEHPDMTPPGALSYVRTSADHSTLLWLDDKGDVVTESPVRVLRAAACESGTPAVPKGSQHHQLVQKAVQMAQEERSRDKLAGRLGSPRGTRYRTYFKLENYVRNREGDLFLTTQARAAVQAVYNHPLTNDALDKLNRALRTDISDDDLAEMVANLHRDEKLVVRSVTDDEMKQPQILCSMGLRDATD